MESSPSPLSLSNVLILGRLGRGGTSHVFRAQSTKDKRLYAMKVIDKKAKNYNSDALEKELAIHSTINTPFAVRLEGHFQDEDNCYVLTEYCEGGEMTRLMAEELGEEKVAMIARQSALALAELHAQGVAHCDLKLSNMLLHKGRIKLCDFGFSQRLDGPNDCRSLCGTIYYMAPEILREKRRVYLREADLWALGISLLILITKRQPYSGQNFSALRKQILKGERVQLSKVSQELADLVNGLLEMDPLKRMTLQQVLSHPFLEKHASVHDQPILTPKHPLRQPKNYNEKMEEATKLTSESEAEDKEQTPKREKSKEETGNKQWVFKRTDVKGKEQGNDCTLERKGNKLPQADNERTVRCAYSSQNHKTSTNTSPSPHTQPPKLTPIQAKLIRPFEQFFYQTKKEGFIRILKDARIQIRVKGIDFQIGKEGDNLLLKGKQLALSDLNTAQKKGPSQQACELFSYAKEVVEILRSKKYALTLRQKLGDCDLHIGIYLNWKKVRSLKCSPSQSILIDWTEGDPFLSLRTQNGRSQKRELSSLPLSLQQPFLRMRECLQHHRPQ